jgi:hypothetical protein
MLFLAISKDDSYKMNYISVVVNCCNILHNIVEDSGEQV